MTRPGLIEFVCEKCGRVQELEAGIKTMYCCAQPMVEKKEVPAEEAEQEPQIRFTPSD